VEGEAQVTDGTARAFVQLRGALVWVLLHASDQLVSRLCSATRKCGSPLIMEAQWSPAEKRYLPRWKCNQAAQHRGDVEKRACDAAIPTDLGRLPHSFVAICRRRNIVSNSQWTDGTATLNGERVCMRRCATLQLQAVQLQPLRPRWETERLLEGVEQEQEATAVGRPGAPERRGSSWSTV